MATNELGAWTPMRRSDVVELFRPAGFRWWLSGGHALELHVGRTWRDHDDIDVGVTRSEAAGLLEVLDGWDIHIGAAGVLTPWDGGPLEAERSQNNLWCRPAAESPWSLDVTVGDHQLKHAVIIGIEPNGAKSQHRKGRHG